jgi:hypothetical protein
MGDQAKESFHCAADIEKHLPINESFKWNVTKHVG